MKRAFVRLAERHVDPLFEVFDGGGFVLSSWRDIESPFAEVGVYLDDPALVSEAAARLAAAVALVGAEASVELEDVPDEDWRLSYRRHFTTERVGRRLLVVPTWELDSVPAGAEGRVVVALDPGMAFGTGKHETTRACLEYIDELSETAGSFLDMGCGSGILSIAAVKLGYAPVSAFDIDPDAVAAASENARRNGVAVDCRVFALGGGTVTVDSSIDAAKGVYPDLAFERPPVRAAAPFPPADLVVANILGPLLVSFAEEIASMAKSRLVASGMLESQRDEVLVAFAPLGFREISRRTAGEWSTLLLGR